MRSGQYPFGTTGLHLGKYRRAAPARPNKELGQTLARQLRMSKKQMSEASELDDFNQYLMGLRTVE